ncbi:MAG TPA: MFS transporter [Candidatus Scatomorpha merdigallinarum]|nr:MFS transporter [Candidatus Scatomorpha merdigallinarum]
MEKKRGIFYGWWIVLACTLIMATFFTLLLSCISLFTVPVTEDLGISRTEFGTFSTILSILGMVLSPVAGKVLAVKNTRIIMSVSLLAAVIGYTCLSFVQNVVMLYVLALIIGTGSAFCTTVPIAVVLTRWFVKDRSKAMSITFAGSSVGAMILSPVISSIIESMGWRMAFRILGLGMLVILVPVVFLLVRSKPEDKGLRALGADEAVASGAAADAGLTGLPLRELRRHPTFWVYVTGIFVMLLTMGAMYHMPAHITGIGISADLAATFVSIYSLIAIFGKLLMGAVFDRFGVKAGILLGTVCMGLCYVFLLIAKTFPMFIVVAVFYGLGSAHGTIFPPTLTSKLYGSKYYSEIFGFVNAFASLSMAVCNLIMAAPYDITGSYTLAWIIGLAAAVFATILLFAACSGAKKLPTE